MELPQEFSGETTSAACQASYYSTGNDHAPVEKWVNLESWVMVAGSSDSGDTRSPSNRSATSAGDDSTGASCCTLDTLETDDSHLATPPSHPCRMVGVDHRLVEACGPFAEMGDVRLLAGMLNLCLLPQTDGDLARHLLRALEMLRRCRFAVEDIRCIIAMASVYFNDTHQRKGVYMDSTELKHVLVLSLFVAHCYTQDEMCPLSTWHKWLFRSYCSLQELNLALMRMLQLRDFKLRIPDDELLKRCEILRQTTSFDLQ